MNQILKILIKVVIEFFAFLLIVVLLNIGASYLGQLPAGETSLLSDGVKFLNDNILWIGLIALLIFLGETSDILKFPLNLPSPLFYSLGIVLIIKFIYDIFMFIIKHTPTEISIPFDIIFIIVSILVVLVVLITGYYSIFSNMPKKKTEGEEDYRYKEKDEETRRKEEQEKKRLEEEHFREADEDKEEDNEKEDEEDEENEEAPKKEKTNKKPKKEEKPKIKKKVKRTRFVR
jgi:hypothetical protein